MKDALLLVDVVNDFRHEDGEALLTSFRARQPRLVQALARARGSIPRRVCERRLGSPGTATPRESSERSRKASAASSWPRSRRTTPSPSC